MCTVSQLDAVARAASSDWLEDAKRPAALVGLLPATEGMAALAVLDAGEDLWRLSSNRRFSLRSLYSSGLRHNSWVVRFECLIGGGSLARAKVEKLLGDPVPAVAAAARVWFRNYLEGDVADTWVRLPDDLGQAGQVQSAIAAGSRLAPGAHTWRGGLAEAISLQAEPQEAAWRLAGATNVKEHELAVALLADLTAIARDWSDLSAATSPLARRLYLRAIELGLGEANNGSAAEAALLRACHDEDPYVQVYAVSQLGWRVGLDNYRLIAEQLLPLMETGNVRLVQVCALALKECCDVKHPPAGVIEKLLELTCYQDALTRAAAFYSLRDAGASCTGVCDHVRACVTKSFERETDPRMRIWIAETLSWLMPIDTWFLRFGIVILKDPSYSAWRFMVPELLDDASCTDEAAAAAVEDVVRSLRDKDVRRYVRRCLAAVRRSRASGGSQS